MLRLVKLMDNSDDKIVEELFDKAVHADRERLVRQIQRWTYGATLAQLCADGVRVAEPERVSILLAELVVKGVVKRFQYRGHRGLYFHLTNVNREPTTREAFKLEAA